MRSYSFVIVGLLIASLGSGCHKDDGKDHSHSNPSPGDPQGRPVPVVALGLNGGLAAGGITWNLPEFLKGQFKELDKANTEAALNIGLTNGAEKKASRVYTGLSVKPCNPTDEAESFVSTVAKPAADIAPASHKINVEEVSSWTAESKTFAGRLFLRKSYKSEGETGVYRIDALVANSDASECLLWNFVFKPEAGTTAAFIEASSEYKALMTSLSTTWEDLGVDLDE